MLRGRFIAIQAYLNIQEKNQINNLTLHLKQLGKEEKNKNKHKHSVWFNLEVDFPQFTSVQSLSCV